VWKLPFNTHRRFLSLICNSLPVEDEICRRFLNFIHTSLGSSELVKFIVKHGILFGGMFSPCGRNVLFCAERYGFSLNDVIDPGFSSHIVMQQYLDNISVDDLNATVLLMELCFIRDNIFYVPELSKGNIVDLLC
jgi:hypothetical protein